MDHLQTSTVADIVRRLSPRLHVDPLVKLPPEIMVEIFSYHDPRTLLTASLTSRAWYSRTSDWQLWRNLYTGQGWRVDLEAIRRAEEEAAAFLSSRKSTRPGDDLEGTMGPESKRPRMPQSWFDRSAAYQRLIDNDDDDEAMNGVVEGPSSAHLTYLYTTHQTPSDSDPSSFSSCSSSSSFPSAASLLKSGLMIRTAEGTAKINWQRLYKLRRQLEDNWSSGRFTNFQLPHPQYLSEAHTERLYAIQYSGKWLVSGSGDRTLRVWDLETRRLRYSPLVGHERSVLCLQFDPAEDIIVSGSSDRSVCIWQFSTGKLLHRIGSAHEDSVLNLKFGRRHIVTCSKDKTIKVWSRHALSPTYEDENYPRRREAGASVRHPWYIIDVSSSTIPSSALLREPLKPYSLLMTIHGHSSAVNAIEINDKEIVSASGDRLIKIWNIRTGALKKTLTGHEKGIACVQLDDHHILSGSNDNTVRIYSRPSGTQVACLRGHSNLVRTVQAAFSRARWGRIVSGSYDETIVVWKKDDVKGTWTIGDKLQVGAASANAAQLIPKILHTNFQVRSQPTEYLPEAVQNFFNDTNGNNNDDDNELNYNNNINENDINAIPPAEPVHPGQAFHFPGRQPTSTVFKIQFDARKIICASRDHKIIGWDFACYDPEIMEASRFFMA